MLVTAQYEIPHMLRDRGKKLPKIFKTQFKNAVWSPTFLTGI